MFPNGNLSETPRTILRAGAAPLDQRPAGRFGHGMADDAQTWAPAVNISLLVRRPALEAWEAFAEPDRIRRFWLARATARLATGARATWGFKVDGAQTDVEVIEARPGALLDLRWDGGQPLRITFEDRGAECVVAVQVTGFDGPTAGADAVDSMSGFTLVLASLKMWLEHGIEGDLMYDRFPDAQYADR